MMTPKAPPIALTNETAELRAELAAVRERLVRVEALLSGLYGPAALGGAGPAPLPPAEPARTMRPIASIGRFFTGS